MPIRFYWDELMIQVAFQTSLTGRGAFFRIKPGVGNAGLLSAVPPGPFRHRRSLGHEPRVPSLVFFIQQPLHLIHHAVHLFYRQPQRFVCGHVYARVFE